MGVGDEESGLDVKSSLSSEVKRRMNDVIKDPLGEVERIMEQWRRVDEQARRESFRYNRIPELEIKHKLDRDVTTLLQLRQIQRIVLPSTRNSLRVQCEEPVLPVDNQDDELPQTFHLEFVSDVSGTVRIVVGQRYENIKPLVGVGVLVAGTEVGGEREVTVREGKLNKIDSGKPFSRLIDIAIKRQETSLTNAILESKRGALVVQ